MLGRLRYPPPGWRWLTPAAPVVDHLGKNDHLEKAAEFYMGAEHIADHCNG
jgi:hypothetical protein